MFYIISVTAVLITTLKRTYQHVYSLSFSPSLNNSLFLLFCLYYYSRVYGTYPHQPVTAATHSWIHLLEVKWPLSCPLPCLLGCPVWGSPSPSVAWHGWWGTTLRPWPGGSAGAWYAEAPASGRPTTQMGHRGTQQWSTACGVHQFLPLCHTLLTLMFVKVAHSTFV